MHELVPGSELDGYLLEAELGRGAVGIVFRAIRRGDGAPVALKVLRSELCGNELFRRRFEHEARAAMGLSHPHLVPILDAGEQAGRLYLAMAYVAGGSLAARITTSGPLGLDAVLRLAADAGAGLDALHSTGLVHRDVKPSNVMFDGDGDGAAALTDFGLAKGPAYTALTKPGQLLGTPHYLAPELIEGAAATRASDLYALGCVVFECLVGVPPFAHRRLLEVAWAHLEEAPPDPCAGRADVPLGVGEAVLEALAKDPRRRPSTATAYAHLLAFAARR